MAILFGDAQVPISAASRQIQRQQNQQEKEGQQVVTVDGEQVFLATANLNEENTVLILDAELIQRYLDPATTSAQEPTNYPEIFVDLTNQEVSRIARGATANLNEENTVLILDAELTQATTSAQEPQEPINNNYAAISDNIVVANESGDKENKQEIGDRELNAIQCNNYEQVFDEAASMEHICDFDDNGIRDDDNVKCSTVEEITEYRQYLCDVCGEFFKQSSHLWQHVRFHRGVRPFACEEVGCSRSFTLRRDLDDHVRGIHTNERPFVCSVCKKSFRTGCVFYRHRLKHRAERRYRCEECGKQFYRADCLKVHRRIHGSN